MNCYRHPEVVAVGICKSCNKGLCIECAVDMNNGIACKNSCEEEVNLLNEQIERGKKIYGIGKYRSVIPSSGVMLWGLFSLVAWGIVVFSYIKKGHIVNSSVVLAIIFTVVFAISIYSAKRTGIKC